MVYKDFGTQKVYLPNKLLYMLFKPSSALKHKMYQIHINSGGEFRVEFRKANEEDLPSIVSLLADDELGAQRERFEEPLPRAYYKAFHAIESQIGNQVILAVEDQTVLGCLQLTIIPGLSRQGMKRGQIEGVRVHQHYRGKEIGEKLVKKAIEIAKSEQCGLVQLTSDKKRDNAHHFYKNLGFLASYEGMKLIL